MADNDCGCKTVNVKRVLVYAAIYASLGALIGAGLAIYTQKPSETENLTTLVPDILTQRSNAIKEEIAKKQSEA